MGRTMSYRIDVARRDGKSNGYDAEPFAATAWLGTKLVAVQFGTRPEIAFSRALRFVREDQERVDVTVVVEDD